MLWNTACDLGFDFFLYFFLIHIYFQKPTDISHNIPESQNSIHNICRVRNFKRNKKKKNCSSFKIVGIISNFIRKKKLSVEAYYQRKYKQHPVS